ncbi:AraC family transcriptional regulator [Actinophytocola xinjiangensis]|uniref:AraC family transcriptional regulator n=1 Tax=Actinophytocola xinjiangensis TaxID=485602 RepID=A0A7Z1AY48_9PSEU|nr:AraC family transcriptional regulator [Actinophytocola xinjiangensis]OLF08711.1 AraC family transcriptional regulator [Actinophytocola xinjiangensis]
MDVLSDVVSVMRTGRPVSARHVLGAPWALRFEPVAGAVAFRVVLRGNCVLVPPDGDPVALGSGDVVLLPHGGGHLLADSLASAADNLDNPDTRGTVDALGTADLPVVADDLRTPGTTATGTPTGSGTITETLCGAYELAPHGGHPLLRDLPAVARISSDGRPELRAAVELLAGELTHPGLGTAGVIPALLDTLLHYALRTWLSANGDGWAAALRDPAVAAALTALHQDPARPWTVATLASVGGLSRSPFARRFTDLTGQPPVRYLTWWRMTVAARLLRTTDTPLHGIARAVGYHSEFAFATAFRRQYGTAPGRYRNSADGK